METQETSRLAESPSLCQATKVDGRPCQNPAQPGKLTCWSHDEANAEQRRRNSSAGGRAIMSLVAERGSAQRAEIAEIKERLRALAADVLEGKVPAQPATVAVQAYNALLRAVDLDRKVRELDEVEARLEALEGRTS
jgi:hypothetical protein